MHSLLHPDQVVDMTPFGLNDGIADLKSETISFHQHNICNPTTAATLVDRVLTALTQMLAAKITPGDCSNAKTVFALDSNIWDLFRIQIPLRPFHPSDILKSSVGTDVKFSDDGVKELQNALMLPIEGGILKVSLEQYFALLELYGNSQEVLVVVQKHFGIALNGELNDRRCIVEELRSGCKIGTFLDACRHELREDQQVGVFSLRELLLHPTVAYVQQLNLFIRYSSSTAADELSGESVDIVKNAPVSVASRRRAAETAVRVVKEAVKLRDHAKMAVEIGDISRAITYITAALEGNGSQLLADFAAAQSGSKSDGTSKSRKTRARANKKKSRRGPDAAFADMFEYYMNGGFPDMDENEDDEEEDDDDDDDDDDDGDDDGEDSEGGDQENENEKGYYDFGDYGGEGLDDEGDVDEDEDEDSDDKYNENADDLAGEAGFDDDMMDNLMDLLGKQFGVEDDDNDDDNDHETGEAHAPHDVRNTYMETQTESSDPRDQDPRVPSYHDTSASNVTTETTSCTVNTDCRVQDSNNNIKGDNKDNTNVGDDIVLDDSTLPYAGMHDDSDHASETNQPKPADTTAIPLNSAPQDKGQPGVEGVDLYGDESFVAPRESRSSSQAADSADVGAAVVVEVEPSRLLPVHLKTSLLTIRAQLYCELGELDNALADCARCINMDPRNAKVYALRSEIIKGYIAQQDAERGDLALKQDEEETKKRQDMLFEVAKDALSGWLRV